MIEAARMDGANKLQEIFYIKVPGIKPVLLTALSVRIIDAAKTFDIIWAMTEGGPNSSSETISIVIYKTLVQCQCDGCYLYHSSCGIHFNIHAEFMESKEKIKTVEKVLNSNY